MGNNGNQIITAVMSRLVSQRDNVLVQLDLVLNKNISNKGVSGIVKHATELFSELSKIELTIETVTGVLSENIKKQNQFSEQVNELKKSFSELQQNNNQEEHGDNT